MQFVITVVGILETQTWHAKKAKKPFAGGAHRMENNEKEDEVVTAIINLVKRIQKLESWRESIDAFLTSKFKLPKNGNNEHLKWDDWARKILAKVLEWTFVIIAAIVGAKLAGL